MVTWNSEALELNSNAARPQYRTALQYNGSSLALPSTTAQHRHT